MYSGIMSVRFWWPLWRSGKATDVCGKGGGHPFAGAVVGLWPWHIARALGWRGGCGSAWPGPAQPRRPRRGCPMCPPPLGTTLGCSWSAQWGQSRASVVGRPAHMLLATPAEGLRCPGGLRRGQGPHWAPRHCSVAPGALRVGSAPFSLDSYWAMARPDTAPSPRSPSTPHNPFPHPGSGRTAGFEPSRSP